MSRHFEDWLQAYVDYASFTEAPKRMHFFAGVSAVAGALRRRVWIDQIYYKWYPNHYIVFVAPPGIVSKSTTSSIAMNLLRRVPGVKFGPDVVTWPALVQAFAEAIEGFKIGSTTHLQCALTLESSEFGNLLDPQDRGFIDLLVHLWDGSDRPFRKLTKTSGKDTVENPYINLIACTTPAWIAGNFPEYVIGGGFTSRCLFVYAEVKDKLVAYPSTVVPAGVAEMRTKLVEDLTHISNLAGPYTLTPEAMEWGTEWYRRHNARNDQLRADDRFGGYLARKQTHIHKLAMVLAAAKRDTLDLKAHDLADAELMISTLEHDMPKVFAKIGLSDESIQAERFIQFIESSDTFVEYSVAYHYIHSHFPKLRDFTEIVKGAVDSGRITFHRSPQAGFTAAKPVSKAHPATPAGQEPASAEVIQLPARLQSAMRSKSSDPPDGGPAVPG